MGKIKLLSEKMTKLIAAGEVVEKPASIVKELVENSIDAGASSIIVEISDGGQTKIVISDDGCGMNKDDILMSVLPHATSKVEQPQDLDAISTLGFRGEALSSISAVSEVTIMSKTADAEFGYKAKFDEGKLDTIDEINCEKGTRIEVANLFYNTPARLKFLRKPRTDEADITDFVERLMMAYSNISFKYYVDGKLKFQTMGSGLKDNIYTIYGKEVFDNLIEIDVTKNDYHLHGFIGRPEIAKPNRNYQTLIIGKRYVRNQMISSSVATAYENFLMKGKFAFYVLFLDLPANTVDVNIHPTKMEVKFENSNFIYGFVLDAVSQALYSTNYSKSIEFIEPKSQTSLQEDLPKFQAKPLEKDFGVSFKQKTNTGEEIVLKAPVADEDQSNHVKPEDIDLSLRFEDNLTFNKPGLMEQIASEINEDQNQVQKPEQFKKETVQVQDFNKLMENRYEFVGRVFETYIILQQGSDVLLIDQHAAHERILFDKFMAQIKQENIIKQDLMFPYTFDLKDKDTAKILDLCLNLQKMGFDICQFGNNTFKISSVPVLLQNISLKEFIDILLAENYGPKSQSDIIHDRIATMACKSAVKGGDSLSQGEIDYIIEKIQQGVLLCPHGRPFVVKISRSQLEKWFGRKQ
mgnify:FL=1